MVKMNAVWTTGTNQQWICHLLTSSNPKWWPFWQICFSQTQVFQLTTGLKIYVLCPEVRVKDSVASNGVNIYEFANSYYIWRVRHISCMSWVPAKPLWELLPWILLLLEVPEVRLLSMWGRLCTGWTIIWLCSSLHWACVRALSHRTLSPC